MGLTNLLIMDTISFDQLIHAIFYFVISVSIGIFIGYKLYELKHNPETLEDSDSSENESSESDEDGSESDEEDENPGSVLLCLESA